MVNRSTLLFFIFLALSFIPCSAAGRCASDSCLELISAEEGCVEVDGVEVAGAKEGCAEEGRDEVGGVEECGSEEESRNDSAGADVAFAYDLDFEMNFDNREYGESGWPISMTIFGARLTPSIGLSVRQGSKMSHKVMLGIDVMKDFGASEQNGQTPSHADNWDLFREITLYYSLDCRKGKTDIGLRAGIFPRRFSSGDYPEYFFSDSLKFYDNNLEGILLTFKRPKAYYEVGCDWMGKYGTSRRERFMIFGAGKADLSSLVTVGARAYMYHFAGCKNVWGVVDNVLVNPYVSLDFGHLTSLQRLGITAGWVQSMQNDRRNVGHYIFPFGSEIIAEVRNWNVGARYKAFIGKDMMPYYDSTDAAGIKYCNLLYPGNYFYRVRLSGRSGVYQRAEFYWEPRISTFLDLNVSVVLHFNESFSGWQQRVSLRFNLQELLGHHKDKNR